MTSNETAKHCLKKSVDTCVTKVRYGIYLPYLLADIQLGYFVGIVKIIRAVRFLYFHDELTIFCAALLPHTLPVHHLN